MLSNSQFARLKAKEARERAAVLNDGSVRHEWFTAARLWEDLARGYADLQRKQAAMDSPESLPANISGAHYDHAA